MKVSYGEGLASHFGLGRRVYAGDGVRLSVCARGKRRPAMELRWSPFSRADLVTLWEGNMNRRVTRKASSGSTRRSRGTCACVETPNAPAGRAAGNVPERSGNVQDGKPDMNARRKSGAV